jgi:hypothetical protein
MTFGSTCPMVPRFSIRYREPLDAPSSIAAPAKTTVAESQIQVMNAITAP